MRNQVRHRMTTDGNDQEGWILTYARLPIKISKMQATARAAGNGTPRNTPPGLDK